MKYLTLIRHAKSSHDSPSESDFDRPLNPRGRQDAPRVARYLYRERKFSPDLIISSPAVRALTTARAVALELGYDLGKIQQEPSIYEAPISALHKVVQRIPDSINHVALFGHNPGLENFTNWLCGHRAIEGLVTMGVILLKINIGSWNKCAADQAELLDYIYPKMLDSED